MYFGGKLLNNEVVFELIDYPSDATSPSACCVNNNFFERCFETLETLSYSAMWTKKVYMVFVTTAKNLTFSATLIALTLKYGLFSKAGRNYKTLQLP